MEVYNNQQSVEMTPEELAGATECIKNIIQNLGFFNVRLQDRPKYNDVHTHMGLFESYFAELSSLVKYDGVLKAEQEKRYAKTRKANQEIRRLKEMMGKGITAEGVGERLHLYDDVIELFCGACGFHYARHEKTNYWGSEYTFHEELEYEQSDGHSRKKEWVDAFCNAYPLLSGEDTRFDLWRDTYHAELLDTDNNRRLMEDFMTEVFPNSSFYEFRSHHNDAKTYSLEFRIHIPLKDIENLLRRVVPDFESMYDDAGNQAE